MKKNNIYSADMLFLLTLRAHITEWKETNGQREPLAIDLPKGTTLSTLNGLARYQGIRRILSNNQVSYLLVKPTQGKRNRRVKNNGRVRVHTEETE